VNKRTIGWVVVASALVGVSCRSAYATESVSIIQLIANPESFNGKDVIVIGYVHLDKPPLYEETSDGIYVSELDYRQHVSKNGLFLQVPTNSPWRQSFQDAYAIIEGTFQKSKGHRGLWSGTITPIKRFEKWPKDVAAK
jgi:hypothetical protein